MNRNCIDRNCLDNNEKLKIKEDAMRDSTENNSVGNEARDNMAENFIKDKSKEKDMKNLNDNDLYEDDIMYFADKSPKTNKAQIKEGVRITTRFIYYVVVLLNRLFKINKLLKKQEQPAQYINPDEVELKFGIAKRVQARYRNAKQLAYIKVGKAIFYTQTDLDEFFTRCRVEADGVRESVKIKSKKAEKAKTKTEPLDTKETNLDISTSKAQSPNTATPEPSSIDTMVFSPEQNDTINSDDSYITDLNDKESVDINEVKVIAKEISNEPRSTQVNDSIDTVDKKGIFTQAEFRTDTNETLEQTSPVKSDDL